MVKIGHRRVHIQRVRRDGWLPPAAVWWDLMSGALFRHCSQPQADGTVHNLEVDRAITILFIRPRDERQGGSIEFAPTSGLHVHNSRSSTESAHGESNSLDITTQTGGTTARPRYLTPPTHPITLCPNSIFPVPAAAVRLVPRRPVAGGTPPQPPSSNHLAATSRRGNRYGRPRKTQKTPAGREACRQEPSVQESRETHDE